MNPGSSVEEGKKVMPLVKGPRKLADSALKHTWQRGAGCRKVSEWVRRRIVSWGHTRLWPARTREEEEKVEGLTAAPAPGCREGG